MGVIIGLVFVGVFAVIALPLIAAAVTPSRTTRQALVTLDSAIKAESRETREQILDLRKDEQLSSIPWLNRRLLKLELTPYLSRVLSQGAVSWTAGRLVTASAVCFAIPSYVAYLKFNLLPHIAWGGGCDGEPAFLMGVVQAPQAFFKV